MVRAPVPDLRHGSSHSPQRGRSHVEIQDSVDLESPSHGTRSSLHTPLRTWATLPRVQTNEIQLNQRSSEQSNDNLSQFSPSKRTSKKKNSGVIDIKETFSLFNLDEFAQKIKAMPTDKYSRDKSIVNPDFFLPIGNGQGLPQHPAWSGQIPETKKGTDSFRIPRFIFLQNERPRQQLFRKLTIHYQFRQTLRAPAPKQRTDTQSNPPPLLSRLIPGPASTA